jgi:hypothetical protein
MMERRNKQNKESLYIIRVRIGVSVLPLPSVPLIEVFLVYSCSFTPVQWCQAGISKFQSLHDM